MRNWYVRNQDKITWFVIGWLSFALAENLLEGDYVWAGVLALLVWLNVKLEKIRLS
jgi:uncharacterized membrane protein